MNPREVGRGKTVTGAQSLQMAPNNLICRVKKCGLLPRNCGKNPVQCKCELLNAGFQSISGYCAVCDCGAKYPEQHKPSCNFGAGQSGGPETQGELL